MTPEQWHRIKNVFHAALELPAEERVPFISRESGDDASMREKIESLLRAHHSGGDFIEAPALVDGELFDAVFRAGAAQTEPMDNDPATERQIGAYRLVREIRRGGMGTVFLAERADGAFRQQVAIKLIKRGMDTDFVLRRFRNERQILASLDHPNIAQLRGGGTTDDDLPYFLMEYIPGAPLYEHCDRARLTTQERLKLFGQICGGAEKEFRRAIELKPENPAAHRWYAFSLSAMNRHDEAYAEILRAQKILPHSPVMATAVANVLFLARRYDEAIIQCRSALELDAGSVAAYVVQRWAYEAKGMKEEALAAFEQERTFAGETPTTHAKWAHVLAACGRHEEGREVLRELLSRREEQGVTSFEIAVIYSFLGDKDNAFHWLAQAEREHAVGFTFVRVDPHLDNLRDDPRYDELLRRASILPRPSEFSTRRTESPTA